jgi:hypothetical protein
LRPRTASAVAIEHDAGGQVDTVMRRAVRETSSRTIGRASILFLLHGSMRR